MDRTDNYHLSIENNGISQAEEYVEHLFHEWLLNEVYLGNVVTAFTNLINILSGHRPIKDTAIQAQLKDEVLSFEFKIPDSQILKMFLKEYLVPDVHDSFTQSVFLIQRMADEVTVEGENLVLHFDIGALPDNYLNHRKHLLQTTLKEPQEKV